VKDRITGNKWPGNLACDSDSHVSHRVLLHAANLQHGTDRFTSPPKEGMLWIFFLPKKSDGTSVLQWAHGFFNMAADDRPQPVAQPTMYTPY
jgi:hypothetical protein